MVQYLKDATRLWDKYSECGISGDRNDTRFVDTIPGNENIIPSLAIWLRATGVLESDYELAKSRKMRYTNLFPLERRLTRKMSYVRAGFCMPPTLEEMYELIKAGETELLGWAEAPVGKREGFETWNSRDLAKGWSQTETKGSETYKYIWCFPLHVHNRLRRYGNRDAIPPPTFKPPPSTLSLKRPTSEDYSTPRRTYDFVAHLNEIREGEKQWLLPFKVNMTYYEYKEAEWNKVSVELSEEDAIEELKVKAPFEPVAHCLMSYAYLRRLAGLGWIFSERLTKLHEALQWYLVLAESRTPSDMWDMAEQGQRPTHIIYALPSRPANTSQIVRRSQLDRAVSGTTMTEHFAPRKLIESKKLRCAWGEDDEYDGDHFYEVSEYYDDNDGDDDERYYSWGRPSDNEENDYDDQLYYTEDGTAIGPYGPTTGYGYLNGYQIEPEPEDKEDPDSDSGSSSLDEFSSLALTGEIQDDEDVDCHHDECMASLYEINKRLIKVMDNIGQAFEEQIEVDGLDLALKAMRNYELKDADFWYLNDLNQKRHSIFSIIMECRGRQLYGHRDCKIGAILEQVLVPELPPAIKDLALKLTGTWEAKAIRKWSRRLARAEKDAAEKAVRDGEEREIEKEATST